MLIKDWIYFETFDLLGQPLSFLPLAGVYISQQQPYSVKAQVFMFPENKKRAWLLVVVSRCHQQVNVYNALQIHSFKFLTLRDRSGHDHTNYGLLPSLCTELRSRSGNWFLSKGLWV